MKTAENDPGDTMKKTRKSSAKREWIDIDGQKIWERTCPGCNKIIQHKNRHSWWTSRKNNTACYSCKNTGDSNPFYGKNHNDTHRHAMSVKQTVMPYVYKSEKFGGIDQRIIRQCFGCGNDFNTTIRNQKRYCSINCFNISQAKRGIYSSFPERKFAQILKSNNIRFEHQYEVDGKIYDFFLSDKNILIEIDGIYWHNRGDVYKSALHEHIRNNDNIKNKIAEDNGFKLIRLWEDELEDVSKYLY